MNFYRDFDIIKDNYSRVQSSGLSFYHSPELIDWGTLHHITQGGGNTDLDGDATFSDASVINPQSLPRPLG